MIIRYYLCPLAGKSWLEHCMVFISCMSKRRYFHMIRESEKTSIFTPPPLNWDMGRAVIIFYKRLTAMLNEKRDSHTANDGVNMFPLELCPPKTQLCLSGVCSFAIIPGNAALCEPVDFQPECPSLNGTTFINILDIYILHSKSLRFSSSLYCKLECLFYKCFSNYTVTIIKNKGFID